jgi:deoxyadenosine/deoxycytidine kinase
VPEVAISCYEDLQMAEEDFNEYSQMFHAMINEHPLLASYSNIFVILYLSLKELSKRTREVTYTWRVYTKMLDMIIAKIIRDLTLNMKNRETKNDTESRQGSKNHSTSSAERKAK